MSDREYNTPGRLPPELDDWTAEYRGKGMSHYPEQMREWAKEHRAKGDIVAASDLECAADHMDKLNDVVKAANGLIAKKPSMNESSGPCCSDYDTESERWIGTGCTCLNYNDAADARGWRDRMNAWIKQQPLREALEKAGVQ